MAVSQAYIFLWGTGIVFVILPHLNLGLLSDYKICGDSECESLMSRVQAIRDHHSKDCRFLSFRRGDSIFVYHKLTGKRDDLWAGTIDKQFGYFPKEAVKEEQVYATMEKIVETQKSDFFCIDESGYPIDSSHLDTGDDDSDQKISTHESETTQTSPYTDDTHAGSPSASEDASTESPASAQESDGASTEENKNKNDADDAAGTHEEEHETPVALNEQGGSPSSSWLSSSVTGWLGLAKEEEPGNLAEGEKKDEVKETQAEDSFTSSVTGWLGLGGKGKPDDAKDSVNSQEEDRETADSFTSTMTGWLGFGGEKKMDYPVEQEHDEGIEMDEEKKSAEKFRSRRLSLDLEANQLRGEEKKEMGTLGWLGNGLSSTLGFGLTNQESGHETTAGRRETEETSKEEEEQPASNSWLDLGITDILGFRKDKNEFDETKRSGFKETEEDKTLEQPTDSQNVDTSQSQPVLTDEAKTELSLERLEEKVSTKTETLLEAEVDSIINSSNTDITEIQQDHNLPSETETQSGNTAPVDADSNGKLEEKSQDVSSMFNSFFQIGGKEEEEGKVLDDNKNEMEGGEDHQMPESVGNEGEVNGREPGEEIKTASDSDQDFVPQNDITSGSVFSSEDLKSNSMGQSVSETEEISKEEEEQPASNSWLDLGFTDVLGFRKDNNEVDETKRSGFKETVEDKTLEQPTDSQNVDTSQSQPALADEAKTEPSLERLEEKVSTKTETVLEAEGDSIISSSNKDTTETQQDQNLPSETETQSGNTAPVDADSNGKLEEKSQDVSSMFNSFFQIGGKEEEEGKVLDDNKNEMEGGEDHQMPESVGNEGEVNGREPGEEIKTANDQDFVPQNDITSGSVFSSEDLKSNSMGQSVSEAEEVKKHQLQGEKTESVNEEETEITKQIDNTEESTEMSVEIGASGDDHKGEGSIEETDVLHREIPTTQSDVSAEQNQVSGGAEDSSGVSLPFLSTDTAEEKNEPVPSEDDSLTVDHSDTLAITDNNTETETHHGELGQGREEQSVEGSSQEFGSSHTTNRSAEMHEHASEEDRGTFSSRESTSNQDTNMDNIDLASVSPQMQKMATKSEGDADKLKETENNLKPAQAEKETLDFEKDFMKESDWKSDTEAETEEESKEEVKQEEIEELKEEEKQEGLKEMEEEKQEEVGELKEQEDREAVDELKRDEKQDEVEDLKKDEKWERLEDLKEETKQEEVGELSEEEKQQEVEEIKEEEKKEEVEEKKQDLVGELNEEEKQEEVEELKKDEKWEGVEELKEEVKQEEVEELKEQENREAVDELKRDEKQEEVELKKDEKWEGVEELKEETKQEEVGELSEEEKQQEVEEIKEEEKKEEVEEKKQDVVGELNEEEKQEEVEVVVEGLNKEDKQEELKEEEKQENLEEVEKGLHSSPHNQNDTGNKKETQDENDLESVSSEAAEKTEKSQTESFQAEEERREGELQKEEKQEAVEEVEEEEKREVEVKQQAKDVEDETRSKEEEESLKCSNELCSQSVQDERHDSEDGSSSAYEGTIQTGKQNPVDDSSQILSARTEESERISFESDEDRIQEEEKMKNEMEEKRNDDAKADVRGKEQKTKNNEENEHIGSKSANGVSDLNFEVDQKGEIEHTDNEVPYSGENDHRLPNESFDHLYSGETKNADLCNDVDMKCAGETSNTEKIIEQIHSDDHNRGTAEVESERVFGLFKNAFSFFGKTPVTEIKASTEPALSLDTNTGEMSQPQASLTPEQELDSTTASSQVYIEDLHPHSPAFAEIQPSPLSLTQAPSHPSSLSLNTEAPLKPNPTSKHYKNLLAHMSVDEITILVELFGRNKLQFLDYILSRSGPVTEDPDDDESILLDIETLLHHHRETLFAPNMRLTDAPQEDKEKTRMLIALQKLEMLLERVRETFNTGKSNISRANRQAEPSCVGASCSTHSKDQEMSTADKSRKTGDSSVGLDDNIRRDEGMEAEKERDKQLSGGTGKEKETEKRGEMERGGKEERVSPEETGLMKQILDFVHQIAEDSSTHVRAVRELLIWLTVQVVSSLPDDIRPGPDLYGVPWEPIIISSLVGLVTMLLFSCRCYSSVKSRLYRSKERWMAEQVAQLLDEKCKVLETVSKCQQEYDELETSLRDSGVLAQTQKTEHLEVKARQLEHAKRELEGDLDQLKDQLEQQREHSKEQERRIAVLEESMKTCEEETKDLQSQEEQAQTTLKVYSMNSDRLQRNLETAGEENALLQESNAQLRQQVEGWAERVSELEEEMRRCEVAYSGMVQDVANKDERITSLTDRLLRMKAWDSDLEEERGEEGGEETSNGTAGKGEENGRRDKSQGHLQKVQKLIYAAKLNADLKSVEEDKDRVFAKLNDEVKAKEDLEVSIKELENEKLSLHSDSEHYSDQVQRLQQKLHIMTEMYQENELKLHRLLTVEEKERLQKEEKLNKADKNIALAMEELHNYRHRAEEMEEELEKTKQSYQTQISAHEKKAHNNWLAARAAERDLSDIRRENALLRQKLTDTQFKMDALDKDPYALDSLARPLPFRAERSPYGPSPLGLPTSETRAFLSPPTLMEGPPARLSPRVSRGPVEPPGGQGEMERSGGPHSDSGSNSPTWERDRRGPPPGPPGPLGPPGYMFPEPGGPMYRRPVPPPGAMGILPPLPHPRGLPPAGPPGPPHPADMADGAYRENSLGPGDESGPTDRRTPPEADPRMGGAPPLGPPMGPMDGPFPRRTPYGPPPPDFYPPRGPGGPPMMPMWAPAHPCMMFPPRFPPGGPPHPHMSSYGPPMRLPPPDGLPPPSMGPPPPQQSLPSLPHSQSPEEHTPSPQDVI